MTIHFNKSMILYIGIPVNLYLYLPITDTTIRRTVNDADFVCNFLIVVFHYNFLTPIV